MTKENTCFEYYQQFAQDAIVSGAHEREDLGPKMEAIWDQTVDTVVVSAFSEISVSDLKESHGISKAAVALRRKRGVQELYDGMPEEFQAKYDLNLLNVSYRKRPFTQVMSERRSRGRGGKAVEIMDYLRDHPGSTAAEAIEYFGLEGHQKAQVKKRLEKWGRTDVPHHIVLRTDEMLREIASARTYEDKQAALDKITKSFMEQNIKGPNSVLIPLIREIRRMGFRVHHRYGGTQIYFDALREGKVAYTTVSLSEVNKNQRYTVGLRSDLPDVERVLSSSATAASLRIHNSR